MMAFHNASASGASGKRLPMPMIAIGSEAKSLAFSIQLPLYEYMTITAQCASAEPAATLSGEVRQCAVSFMAQGDYRKVE
jgi:hypothetical protein